MVKKSLFDLFLFLSIVAILIGIATIIFIQIDRGYVVSETSNDAEFEQQQNRLIEYLYRSTDTNRSTNDDVNSSVSRIGSSKNLSGGDSKQAVAEPQTLKLDAPASPAPYLKQPARGAIDPDTAPTTFSTYDDYERYWLSQNPWSPDYQPGY